MNDLIDRVALTGPGGTDKIKKILKELANGSGGSGCDCPGAMFVHGTVSEINDEFGFTQNDGEPSPAAAKSHIEKGGTLYIVADTPNGNLEIPFSGFSYEDSLFIFQDSFDRVSIYWQYAPDTDFSIRIDFNNSDIGETDELKLWFTQLDESTVGGAETCELLIDNYSRYSNATLSKQANGVFVYSETSGSWALASREFILSLNPSLTIPETVKYAVVYEAMIS